MMSGDSSSDLPDQHESDSAPASVGQLLRRARESRGLSIAQIAQETKIGKRFLASIESDEYDRLPGGIFNRAFIRAFANQVGADAERSVQLYEQALSRSPGREPRVAGRRTELVLWAGGGLLVLLLAVILWYFWG